MEARKKWALPLGLASVVLLILWGALGVGTASKLFPEKPKAMPSVTASEGSSSFLALSQEESRRVYDASSYVRGKPLADPFHMEAMTGDTCRNRRYILACGSASHGAFLCRSSKRE